MSRIDWRTVRVHTRAVLAGAYRGRDIAERVTHTHLVALTDRDSEDKVGCSGVEADALVDQYGHSDEELRARPTCPTCAKKWDRRKAGVAVGFNPHGNGPGELVIP